MDGEGYGKRLWIGSKTWIEGGGNGGMGSRFRNGDLLYPLPIMVEQRFYKKGLRFFKIISKSAV